MGKLLFVNRSKKDIAYAKRRIGGITMKTNFALTLLALLAAACANTTYAQTHTTDPCKGAETRMQNFPKKEKLSPGELKQFMTIHACMNVNSLRRMAVTGKGDPTTAVANIKVAIEGGVDWHDIGTTDVELGKLAQQATAKKK